MTQYKNYTSETWLNIHYRGKQSDEMYTGSKDEYIKQVALMIERKR